MLPGVRHGLSCCRYPDYPLAPDSSRTLSSSHPNKPDRFTLKLTHVYPLTMSPIFILLSDWSLSTPRGTGLLLLHPRYQWLRKSLSHIAGLLGIIPTRHAMALRAAAPLAQLTNQHVGEQGF